MVITIDGPSASGKSTASRLLSESLGCPWVSTGSFYRAVAWIVRKYEVDPTDPSKIFGALKEHPFDFKLGEKTEITVEGVNVTSELDDESLGTIASKISQHPEIREYLLPIQRSCAERHNRLVAEGRDCGTVVFPNAVLKVYLTATGGARAARRAKEQGLDERETLKSQESRDSEDSSRKVAPLKKAKGAFEIDSSSMTLDEVVTLIRQKLFDIGCLKS